MMYNTAESEYKEYKVACLQDKNHL